MTLKTETLVARLRQILGDSSETALLNGMLTLQKAELATQHDALSTLLLMSWQGELEMAERWTVMRLLQNWIEAHQKAAGFIPAELIARFRALWWLRHSAKDFLEREWLTELVSFPLEVRRLAVTYFRDGIPTRPVEEQGGMWQAVANVEKELAELNHLEMQSQSASAQANEAWLQFLIKVNLLRFEHWRHAVIVPSFRAERAEALTRLILSYDFGEYPQDWAKEIQMSGINALSVAISEEKTRLEIVGILNDEAHPVAAFGRSENMTNILRVAQDLQDAGKLPGLSLAAIRRSATQPYGTESLQHWLSITSPELNPGEAWSDALLARLDQLPDTERRPWSTLIAFARTATTGKPTARWLTEAQKHLGAVDAGKFCEMLSVTLPLLMKSRTFPLNSAQYGPNPNLILDEFNAQSLKGLLWLAPLVADAGLARAIAGVVDSALKKVPGVGPRAPKIANAAVYALSQIHSDVALSALARLMTTVTFKGTLKEVQKGLEAVARRLNTSPEDLLELGVPTLGLQRVGEQLETLGPVEVRLTVDASGVRLTFSKDGKPLKSVPASVKRDFADQLRELKLAQKEAEQAVSALSLRIDSLMIQDKSWRGDAWQERYLNHPLAGTVARRLIWLLDTVPVFWKDGELQNVNGHPLDIHDGSEVKLWHPISQPVEEVMAWRERLEELQIKQPFKQAWREVYLLTDAERRTETYSNRFAGHILKQHQFNQLAALRGWRNKLRLMVDDSYPPAQRDLSQYGLRAEYWIEGVGENYGEDTTESGSFLRVATDQLRFYPRDAPENNAHASGGGYTMWVNQEQRQLDPLPLEQVPPLVLSEIMRDVDLFVGVASVGNDPTWQDGGPGGRFREYWQSYSFGELNESAKTRTEYLIRLIPRLNIKDRLSLDGRFLKVRGERRAYKIHLGSSNILMEPNDQYLCILPGGKNDGLALDFDGDRVLSLILSKAFLLADDTNITDPVILSQLGR